MLTINLEAGRKCKRCGKGFATESGYCFACIAKRLKEGEYDHIIKQKRKEIAENQPEI